MLPLNVFVNKKYHASLYHEHQTVGLFLCPDKSSLMIVPGNRKMEISGYGKNSEISTPQLRAGEIGFYQIAMDNDNSGKNAGRWVEEEQARAMLKNFNIQSCILFRVDREDGRSGKTLFR